MSMDKDFYKCFETEKDEAYFWSGLGKDGAERAAEIAKQNGGTTLEMKMEQHKDEMIKHGFEYDEKKQQFEWSDDNKHLWDEASKAYAEQAKGNVHAVLGDNVREGSTWNRVEKDALAKNDKVNKVTSVDPKTGKDKDVIMDKGKGASKDHVYINKDVQNKVKDSHMEQSNAESKSAGKGNSQVDEFGVDMSKAQSEKSHSQNKEYSRGR